MDPYEKKKKRATTSAHVCMYIYEIVFLLRKDIRTPPKKKKKIQSNIKKS